MRTHKYLIFILSLWGVRTRSKRNKLRSTGTYSDRIPRWPEASYFVTTRMCAAVQSWQTFSFIFYLVTHGPVRVAGNCCAMLWQIKDIKEKERNLFPILWNPISAHSFLICCGADMIPKEWIDKFLKKCRARMAGALSQALCHFSDSPAWLNDISGGDLLSSFIILCARALLCSRFAVIYDHARVKTQNQGTGSRFPFFLLFLVGQTTL